MGDQISVSSDRTGEMRVDVRGQTVVPELSPGMCPGAKILGRHHASGGHDSDKSIEERFGWVDASVE